MTRRVGVAVAAYAWLALGGGAAGAAEGKVVIAHRGASGYLPEHTLPAVAVAHVQGADFLEQDVVLSKDGVPVVLHDIHLDTVTDVARRFPSRKRPDGRYYAIDFTLAELRQLAVSERFDPRTGRAVFATRFPAGVGRFEIPTLEEELILIQGLNRSTGRVAGIYPEVKEPAWHRAEGRDVSRAVLDVLARYGYRTKQDPVYVQCFDPDEVRRLRTELLYQGRLVQLIEAASGAAGMAPAQARLRTAEGLAEVARVADGIGPAASDLVTMVDGRRAPTPLVAEAHRLGLVVHPYTFRADALPPGAGSFEDLLRVFLFDVGVDGVFTDQPDRVVRFLASRAEGGPR